MDQAPALKLFPQTAQIASDGHLHIAGLDVIDLAREFGTPLYVYDAETISARCRAYRCALSSHYLAPAEVTYAAKAFLCVGVAQLIASEGLGLDVVSGGELYIARQAGFPTARIHLHGNNKSASEMAQALDAGVGRIVVDNAQELAELARIAATRDVVVPIWLRVSPDIDAHTHTYRKTGLLDSKFGLPLATGDAARAVQAALSSPYLTLRGLHAHIGSQILELEPFCRTVEALLDLTEEMAWHGFSLHEFSPGGGLGVPYVDADPGIEIETYVRSLSHAVVHGCQTRGLPLPRLVLEPGRSIIGPAGVALYTVGVRKEIPGVRTYVSVDGGMADNPRPALYGAQYTALVANKADQRPIETVAIAGKFCESGDILIHRVCLPYLNPGDILAIPVSGAYHLAMSSNYNQAHRPAAVLVRDGQARIILRRETDQDLARRNVALS